MVDVVGCLGYCGQEIFFLDSERFGFIAGRGVCIYDVKKGPREMIWSFKSHNNSNNSFGDYDDKAKEDNLSGDYKGIRKVAVNFENKIIALCYRVSGGSGDVDILKINDQSLVCTAENPTTAELVEIKFSRQGDRLFAISDSSTGDHEIIIWKLTGTKAVLLLTAKLNLVCKYCFVNPCDSNYFVLFGDDSPYVVVGIVTEILGQFSLKLFPVKCSVDSNAQTTKIQYALWIPISAGGDVKNPDDNNRLLVGLGAEAAGAVFEVRCGPLVNSAPSQSIAIPGSGGLLRSTQSGSVGRYLGRFTVPSAGIESTGRILVPTCAILSSSQNIVIGTEEGNVYWFPLLGLVPGSSETNGIVGLSSPLQQMVLHNAVGSITMDEEYSFIVVGTTAGDIFKAPLELKETSLLNYEGDKRGDGLEGLHHHRMDDEIGMSLANALIDVEQVEPELVGQEMKSGSVLCCKYLSMGVKCAGRTKPTLSMFLTGSHLGVITFWRQQAAHTIENLTHGGGIRKSAPRAISSILNITTGQQRLPNKAMHSHGHSGAKVVNRNPAVCTIEFIQFPEKPYFYLVFVGTDDGWLEIWSLEALEHSEEDDVKESPDQKIVDDDEGSGLVRLVTRKIYDYRLYHSALSTMVPIFFFSEGKNYFNIATASHSDSRIFLLNVITNEKVTLKNLPHFITLDEGESPQSLVYTNNVLQVWCKSGSIFVFSMESEEDNYGRLESKLGFSGLFQSMLLKQESTFIVLGETNTMYSLPHELVTQIISEGSNSAFANAIGTDLISVRKFEHEDVVVSVSQSPNGRFIATGSVDGTVYLWRMDPEDGSINLANKIYLHAGAVLGLAFSADSSLLMSTAVDGSCFIVTLDKPLPKLNLKSGLTNAGINLSKFFAEDFSSTLTSKESHFQQYGTMTWSELKEAEKLKETQLNFKFKSMGITSAVNEISHRLKILLQQNSDRSELEKLNREEFVIDEDRKNVLVEERAQKISDIHSMYEKRNTWHELRAARVRQKCWDSMEVKSVTLLSFALATTASFMSADVGVGRRGYKHAVSSYPISKNTPDQNDIIDKVKRLRGIEVKFQHSSSLGTVHRIHGAPGIHRSAWYTSLKGCPPTATWISNDGTRWPVNDQIDKLLSNEKIVSGAAVQAAESKEKEKGAAPVVAVVDDDDEMSANSLDDDHGIDENNILNLLYPPHAVRTQVQKRTQIILLKDVIRQLRMRFNEKFTQLYKEKEDIFGSIESRNMRIRAILDDLHQKDEVVTLKLTDLETPGSALRVDVSELSTKPYESEVAKAARLREEEERIRRELENDKEDIKGRALDEMMFGTLEVKRDVFAEASALQKPEWMDTILVSEMNESELKEYDAFQQKLKTLQEEQASYRKLLEQEMKKLKNEIADSCKVFDEKLDEMSKLKILVHREILSMEIYISRLALNMAKTEQTWKSLKKTEQQIQSLRKDRNEVRSKIDSFSVKFEEMKTRIGVLQEEERQMDKSFKRDLQNLCNNTFDQDSLKIFTLLFRMRTYPRGAYNGDGTNAESFGGDQSEVNQSESGNKTRSKGKSASASANKTGKYGRSSSKGNKGKDSSSGLSESAAGGDNKGKSRMKASNKAGASASNTAMGPMQQAAEALKFSLEEGSKISLERDPFYDALLRQDKIKKMNEGQIPVFNALSMESDCPEDFVVDQFSWAKLNDLRSARIEKEMEVKKLMQEFADLKGKLERLDAEEAVLVGCLNEMKSARDVLVAGLRTLESDLDIVVCLRQGQDEVDKDAAVTDYSKALMLPTDILGKYNSRIKELGREKIAILTKTKQFRRKINMYDWEAKHNFMEAKHFEAYLTDLQLFRVTRDLQKIIRDGSDASQTKERLEKVALRKDFLQKDAEERLNTLRQSNELLKKQLQERNQECAQLEVRIGSLHGQVSSCQAVKSSRDEARGDESSPANIAAGKMKKVVGRRNMVDTARAQAEEIDFLRQELDKMRQRTFPSFVRATRKRVAANSEMGGI